MRAAFHESEICLNDPWHSCALVDLAVAITHHPRRMCGEGSWACQEEDGRLVQLQRWEEADGTQARFRLADAA